MVNHEQALHDIALLPDVQREIDPYNKKRSIFWRQTDRDVWQRIMSDQHAEIVTDGDARWTKAFTQQYEEVRRTLWQRLRKTEIAGAITAPGGREMQAVEQRRDAFLLWMREAGMDIDNELQRRWGGERQGVAKLGRSVALLEGVTPLRRDIVTEPYSPGTEEIVPEEMLRSVFNNGLSFILGQVSDVPHEKDDFSVQLLRELKRFRQDRVRWAALDGDAIMTLEPGERGGAWLIILPPDHPRMQTQPEMLAVDTGNEVNMLTIKPFAITREWAGIGGAHELMHLADFVTGREPKRPNRAQYLAGEVRAFTGEIAAANILSRGQLQQALDAVIAHYRFQSLDEVLPLLTTEQGTLIAVARDLDGSITKQRPLSNSEAAIRLAFYFFALAFRLSESKGETEEERIAAHAKTVEVVYDTRGVLPKE